jgi:hypothetical protein
LAGQQAKPFRGSAEVRSRSMDTFVRGTMLFIILTILASCSTVPPADPSQPSAAPEYERIVSNYIKGECKISPSSPSSPCHPAPLFPWSTYTDFEISDLRWIHAMTGWNWLACVRFNDRGTPRFYSFFIQGNTVVFSRYDVMTDNCAAQKYAPFDVGTGATGPAAMSHWEPLH